MPRDDTAYLLDMLLAARDAVSFAEGMSYADFARDRRTQLSILKSVEIVGEAASRLSEDTRRGASVNPLAGGHRHAQSARSCLFQHRSAACLGHGVQRPPFLIAQLETLVPPEVG